MGSYGTGTAAWSRAINNHLAANSIHTQLNISAETLEGPDANIRRQGPELPPFFTHPFFSMFFLRLCFLSFFFLLGKPLQIFFDYEFGMLGYFLQAAIITTSTNGPSLMDICDRGFATGCMC